MRRTVRLLIGLSALLLVSCTSTPPAPPKPVNLIVFPGGFNWPVWVAQEKGLFAKNGIEVRITPTPSSVFQLTNLIDGKFDIAMTAIDNLIAYREGQGEVPKLGPDLFAFMGGDNGFLRLVTVPEVKSYRELRGKTLSVDALTTGYAFVLFEMLGRNKGLVGGARKSWAEKNSDSVVGYIRGFSDGVDWLYDPANRDEAISIFLKNLPNATPQSALVAYGILLSPVEGFQKKAKIDLEGVKTVLALRSKYGKPHKVLKDPTPYYDPSFYEAAMFK